MPFKPGNTEASKSRRAKPYADALRIAILEADGDSTKLRRIAEKHVRLAMDGDMQAIKEVADRLDGKPAQEQTLTVRNELDSQSEQELRELIRREIAVSGGNGAALEAPEDQRVIN